jgi:cell division protein FtsQ
LTIRARKNRKRSTTWSGGLPSAKQAAVACSRVLRRALPAAITIALAGGLGTAGYFGYRAVTSSPRFAITAIEIRGAQHADVDALRARLSTRVGDNVFRADTGADTLAALNDPWIASASVSRSLPHTLVVDVTERTAVALVDLGGLYLVDANGHPFKRARVERGDGAGLPVVTGLDRETYAASPDHTAQLVLSALSALTTWKAAGDRPAIGEVSIDPFGALTLHTYDRATAIALGGLDAGLPDRMRAFDATWGELTDAERDRARAIHLTRNDHVTVALN